MGDPVDELRRFLEGYLRYWSFIDEWNRGDVALPPEEVSEAVEELRIPLLGRHVLILQLVEAASVSTACLHAELWNPKWRNANVENIRRAIGAFESGVARTKGDAAGKGPASSAPANRELAAVPLGEWTIKNLLHHLRPRELYALVAAVGLLLSAVFTLGYTARGLKIDSELKRETELADTATRQGDLLRTEISETAAKLATCKASLATLPKPCPPVGMHEPRAEESPIRRSVRVK
jgi:hypothetical protein